MRTLSKSSTSDSNWHPVLLLDPVRLPSKRPKKTMPGGSVSKPEKPAIGLSRRKQGRLSMMPTLSLDVLYEVCRANPWTTTHSFISTFLTMHRMGYLFVFFCRFLVICALSTCYIYLASLSPSVKSSCPAPQLGFGGRLLAISMGHLPHRGPKKCQSLPGRTCCLGTLSVRQVLTLQNEVFLRRC